jgi:hypothetical protein
MTDKMKRVAEEGKAAWDKAQEAWQQVRKSTKRFKGDTLTSVKTKLTSTQLNEYRSGWSKFNNSLWDDVDVGDTKPVPSLDASPDEKQSWWNYELARLAMWCSIYIHACGEQEIVRALLRARPYRDRMRGLQRVFGMLRNQVMQTREYHWPHSVRKQAPADDLSSPDEVYPRLSVRQYLRILGEKDSHLPKHWSEERDV